MNDTCGVQVREGDSAATRDSSQTSDRTRGSDVTVGCDGESGSTTGRCCKDISLVGLINDLS